MILRRMYQHTSVRHSLHLHFMPLYFVSYLFTIVD